MATLETTPKLYVRCLLRPDAFDRVSNPGFETNTTGWSVSAGINGAGTSITRITTDAHTGSACGSLVCGTGGEGGVNYDFGSTRFWTEATYGTMYVALVWLKRVSGARRARIVLGSEGSGDITRYIITDLADEWRPYRVVWCPTGDRTDVQLAITTEFSAALTVLIDDVSVRQVDAFSQVENGNFLADTTGWSVSAGINGAGTSITRGTSTGFAAGTDATLVTTGTSGSGVNFAMPGRTFVSGRTYRARVALRHASGASVRLRLGSAGTGADRGDKTVTAEPAYEWYYVDWTPSGDRTDAQLAISNASAAILTIRITSVEVYEAIDELTSPDAGRADVSSLSWSRGLGTVGTINATLHDPVDTHRYTPWYTSGPLYGLLATGRRIWARASYANVLYGLAFGSVRRWVPDVHTGTCQVLAEDPMLDLASARVNVGFADDRSYRDARSRLFGAGGADADILPIAGDARTDLTDVNTEQGTFYDGTNGRVAALDYLNSLNDANGTVHHIVPRPEAERLWAYTTVSRSEVSDAASASTTITEDDFADLRDMDLTDEAVETTQSVGWQAYERLGDGLRLMQAVDPAATTSAAGYVLDPEDDPYLHYLDDRYGTDEDVVEPTYEREVVWKRVRRRKGKKKVRVRTYRYRRVYPNAFVPYTLAASEIRTRRLTFSIPVSIERIGGVDVEGDASPGIVAYAERVSPREVDVIEVAIDAGSFQVFGVTGSAWLPKDEQTVELTNDAGILAYGEQPGPVSNTPYVPSLGAAQGMAKYREWRYGAPRMRPTLRNEHRYDHMLSLAPTGIVSVTAARFSLSSSVFGITGLSGSVEGGGLRWAVEYALEALPTSPGTLFTLGTSELGGSHVLAY